MSIRRLVENLMICAVGLAAAAASAHVQCAEADRRQEPVSFVDPFVGTAGTGHTTPAACVPFGLVQAGPDTGFGDWPHCSGYIYGDKTIVGFTQTHLNGTGCPDLGDVRIVPMGSAGEKDGKGLPFDKSSEVAEPGYYAVTLKEPAVQVEIAAAAHSAIYRLTPETDGELRLLVEPKALFFNPPEFPEKPTTTLAFAVRKDAAGGVTGLSGAYRASCWVTREVGYAVAFDREARCVGENVYAFQVKRGEPLTLKVGLAAGGGPLGDRPLPERAKKNLSAEIPGWDFDGVKATARAKWNEALGVATIEGTDEQKRNWYTALYHLCVQPNNTADVGDKSFYSTFSCWDTFRAAGPLYTILYPEKAAAFVDSMLEQGKRTGYLPIWTLWGKDSQCMIGTHSVPMIVDWFLKEQVKVEGEGEQRKVKSNQWEEAYQQIKETLTKRHEGRIKENWDLYDKYGYYPFDKIKGESVSRTLECAYDDWCAAQMAKALGKDGDYAFFMKRAGYWKNVFDPSIGFVRGKDSQGQWRTPYDPFEMGHGAGTANDFTEGNAFQYSWHVMQDVSGLMAAMGGREAFVKNLDALFCAPEKVAGNGSTLDVTGLIGQYVHGNEPSHHVIYFYPQVGHPNKAAERIREVFDKFYLPKPDGLCGNDDCGQMSAWYLFSAMGFYPFNPCGGEYVVGAPQFEKVTLRIPSTNYHLPTTNYHLPTTNYQLPSTNCHLPTTNSFTIVAKNLSKENKYVKAVTLNGKPVTDWKIRHADIMAGGELVFEMGAEATSAVGWKAALPRPIYDAHPEYVELYDKAWEIAHTRIKELKGIPAPRYMDEALWDDRIWIWDTCFMVQFCKYLPKEFPGVESLENFYGVMLADKATPLPRVTCDENTTGKRGATLDFMIHHPDNPPLFAWTEFKYALQTGDRARLERVYGEKQWLQTWFELFESFDPAAPQPHGSCCPVALKRVEDGYYWKGCPNGMDNTPRGRTADWADADVKECPNNPDLLWVDAIAQQGLSALYLARIAALLGRPDEAAAWQMRYEKLRDKVNRLYWDETDGVYYDILAKDRSKVRVLTPASFWPALAEMATSERMTRLSKQLDNPETLGGDVPTPSVARNDVAFDPKGAYWRGGVWLPTTYMTVKALDAYGDYARARTISEKVLARMSKTYSGFEPHTIWECYSPTEDKPSTAKFGEWSRHDFCGWSALGPISLFIEDVIGLKEADAFTNTLVCDFPKDIKGRMGVENYRFGTVVCSVIATSDDIKVESTAPFRLVADGVTHEVVRGKNTFVRRVRVD